MIYSYTVKGTIWVANEEFVSLLKGIVEKDLPDLTEQGYQVAKERNIENIGRQLKKVYEAVLQGNDTDDL